MFTGLVEGTGRVMRVDRQEIDARMILRPDFEMENLTLGESISVDGACLTVVHFTGDVFTVDVSSETLTRTTLGRKGPGTRCNLERALKVGDRLGGHLVTGHVDGLGRLVERFTDGRSWRMVFQVPESLTAHIIEKGSIAVNGVSLTVNGCEGTRFHINIIPHTAGLTTIGDLAVGDEVNIETDLIGKYVEKMLGSRLGELKENRPEQRVSAAFLRKHGFLD